ncbi:hypothetical protein [Streptomyces sp. NPDC048606]|uniref:hypothetical protein n=1 Tax=Streptomyces sp. NPDC048606 TaxID=3154726 RepID=UPI003435B35E
MVARAVPLGIWALVLLLVDAYVIGSLWGQFLFTGASLILLTWIQQRIEDRKQR